MKKRASELVRHQNSIFYPREQKSLRPFEGHYTYMFLEDLRLKFMPIGGRSTKRPFKVELTPPNKEHARRIAAILAEKSYERSLAEDLCDFLPQVAVEVCVNRRATYEIVYFENPKTKQLVDFDLSFVPEEQLVQQNGRLYQTVPTQVAQERGVEPLILLRWENILFFEAPQNLQAGIDGVMGTLPRLSGFQCAELVTAAQGSQLPYDFQTHQKSMSLALAEACKQVGWTGRGELYGKVLSYYWIRQDLIFAKFITELRSGLLKTLNEALCRIGRQLNFEAEIQISGLPTMHDIDAALEELKAGSKAFTEIMDPLLY